MSTHPVLEVWQHGELVEGRRLPTVGVTVLGGLGEWRG